MPLVPIMAFDDPRKYPPLLRLADGVKRPEVRRVMGAWGSRLVCANTFPSWIVSEPIASAASALTSMERCGRVCRIPWSKHPMA